MKFLFQTFNNYNREKHSKAMMNFKSNNQIAQSMQSPSHGNKLKKTR